MARRQEPKRKKPPEIKPWDIPPLPNEGDEKDATTFEAAGRALSAWEAFELELSRTFGALIGANRGLLPAIRAYGSVLTFRGRVDMVKAAAEVFFLVHQNEAKLKTELRELLKLAMLYSPRRNEIAHGIVLRYAQFLFADSRGYCLGPAAYATSKQELSALAEGQIIQHSPRYCYTASEINAFRDRFYDDLMKPTRRLVDQIFRKHPNPRRPSP